MNLPNFDEQFADYLSQWIESNRSRFATVDAMEDETPEVYMKWLNTPADWLDGATPGAYFERYADGSELCALLKNYIANDVPVPDPLLERLGEAADDETLLNLAKDKAAPCEARMDAIELLREKESTLPMVEFIRWQVERDDEDDLLDNALESLREMGESVVRPCKIAFAAANSEGKEALLDVLADYPGDQDVFAFALEQFKTQKDKRALYAGYLAKLDDDHALEALLDVAEGDDVSYTDFIEIRSAIERLGSEAPVRDWSQDETYQAFKKLQKR